MNNFLSKLREYYDTLFPIITDENIARRTIIFYVLLYLSLFFTGYTIGAVSVSNLTLTIVLYLFLGLTASNFILSNKKPDPVYFFNMFNGNGFNLFIALFILYVGFIFLLGSFIFAFNINLYEFKYANILVIILLIIFLIFSLIIFFYYIRNGIKGMFNFIQRKTKKM